MDPLDTFVKVIEVALGKIKFSTKDSDGVLWVSCSAASLPIISKECIEAGATFDSAFLTPLPKNQSRLSYIFRLPIIERFIVVRTEGSDFPSISASIDAARWDERKIQDLKGIKFSNMPDSRPLIFHPDGGGLTNGKPNPDYVYEMKGTGANGEFMIPVGPVHAGIIEPGHFRFHVFGETINKLEIRMFYLHRGIEKTIEGKTVEEALPIVEQISGDESVANAVAYCYAVEKAMGIKSPPKAEAIRLILLELERIYSHLADLGGMATDVGFYLSAAQFAVLREDMMRLNKSVTGHRFLHGVCSVGGVSMDFDKKKLDNIKSKLSDFSNRLSALEEVTFSNPTFLDRVFTAGKVTKADAERLALVGPVARAIGISCDLRKQFPYSHYSKLNFNESTEAQGDVLCRFLVKLAEVKEAVRLVNAMIQTMPAGSLKASPSKNIREDASISSVEAPRGACTMLVELEGNGKIRQFSCRTASFRNWRGIENAVLGNIVPDFPLINKSFNLSYAGTDL